MSYNNDSSAYDPYIPGGGAPGGGAGGSSSGGNAKTAQIQAQIDQTVGVMRDNINKVNERGENLNSLQDKTGALQPPQSGLSYVLPNFSRADGVLLFFPFLLTRGPAQQTTSPSRRRASDGGRTGCASRCGGRT